MKVEQISPFVEASIAVLESVLKIKPERGKLAARPEIFTTQQINVVCGVTGELQGQVIFGMPVITADKIASSMLGTPIVTFDQLAASAIAELGNMICGNSTTKLAANSIICDITPPTIVRGTNVRVTTLDIPAIVIPLNLDRMGSVEINVSVKERVSKVPKSA